MMESVATKMSVESAENLVREGLSASAETAEAAVPVLRHILSSDDNSLFSDDIVARMRGMLRHLAVQMLDRVAAVDEGQFPADHDRAKTAALCDALVSSPALVAHLHGLALEWQLGERLHGRYGLDQVLTPLVQSLVAASDPALSALSMRFLAAQSRHCQAQRRMKLPLCELPATLMHEALAAVLSISGQEGEDATRAAGAAARIREQVDEAGSRLGLMAAIIAAMGAEATSALSVGHAGAALFATALSAGSGLGREEAILSTHEGQVMRLALALRAAGMKPQDVRGQCVTLHPDIEFPDAFELINADRAAAILANRGGRYGA